MMSNKINMSYILDFAISAAEKLGLIVESPIYDQEGLLLGYNVEFPNKRKVILLGAERGYIVKDLGYTKSIDFLLCLLAKKVNKDLLLYIHEKEVFYLLSPHLISQYMKKYRRNNLIYPIKILKDNLCPICGEQLSLQLHNDMYSECAQQLNDAIFECNNHRLKFNKVPLNVCGAKNINFAKTIAQSESERWFDALFREEGLNLIYTGDKQVPIIKEIYGFFPDWVYALGKKVVEYDGSKRKDGKRKELVKNYGFDIFTIEKNWRIYEDDLQKQRKLIDQLRFYLGIDKQMQLDL